MNPPGQTERTVEERGDYSCRQALEVDGEQIEQIVETALFDRQRAVDEGLGQIKTRPGQELPVQSRIVKPDRDVASRRSLEAVFPPASVSDMQPAFRDDPFREMRQQHHASALTVLAATDPRRPADGRDPFPSWIP